MKKLNTNIVVETVSKEVAKLGEDKKLHFVTSYALGLKCPLYNESAMIPSSITVVRTLLNTFEIGLIKEYKDAGKSINQLEELFTKLDNTLYEIYKDYEANKITKEMHETDLLADLIGAGTYLVTESMNNLNWINNTITQPDE